MAMTRPLTGRRVLAIALAAFGVILAANITMSVYAVRSFSGLVVPNSYVASQSFDARRDAQQALGWDLALGYADGALTLALSDAAGRPVRPEVLEVSVGRPTTTRDDRALALEPMPEGYGAGVDLAPGSWRVEIVALAADGTPFHQSRSLTVTAR
jgi:nitrogen fixation protein FixH